MRALTAAVAATLALVAVPAGADPFLPDPESCHYTTHHTFHLGNGKTTEIRVTFTSQRFTTCTHATQVAQAWAATAGCHDTRYCRTLHDTFSCHNRFYSHSSPIAHCAQLHSGHGEVFMTWHRVDRG